ncbi:MAG: LytTR family DNA-binding domain-containing protein [Pseudomonadota bacterium]
MTVRALIVDDEEPGRINLRYALADHPGWEVVAECDSAAAASAVLGRHAVDVVFLDIQMPQQSGLELAGMLAAQASPPLVIFVTAHDEFALEAFEVHALDYLLKPVNDARLAAALGRAQVMLEQRQRGAYGQALRGYVADSGQHHLRHLSVRAVGSIESIALADVHWIEACGNYVQLHMAQRMVMHRIPISRLAARLDPADFMQVHRRAIIRSNQLQALEVTGDGTFSARLACGARVAVSERYAETTRARMG